MRWHVVTPNHPSTKSAWCQRFGGGVPTESKPKPQHPKGSRLKQKTPTASQPRLPREETKTNQTQPRPNQPCVSSVNVEISTINWNFSILILPLPYHISNRNTSCRSRAKKPKPQKFEICSLYNYIHGHYRIRTPPKSLQNHLPLQNHKLGVLNTIKNESLQNWLPSLEQNLW